MRSPASVVLVVSALAAAGCVSKPTLEMFQAAGVGIPLIPGFKTFDRPHPGRLSLLAKRTLTEPPLGPPRPRKSLRPRESHPRVIPDYPGLSRIKTFDRPHCARSRHRDPRSGRPVELVPAACRVTRWAPGPVAQYDLILLDGLRGLGEHITALAPDVLTLHGPGFDGLESPSPIHLTQETNLVGLMAVNREVLAQAEMATRADRIVLDMDSSESPVHGAQEGSAYNGHFESVCYHPLFLFTEHGDWPRRHATARQRA